MDDWLQKQGVKLCKGCNRVLWAGDPDYCDNPECQAKAPQPEPEPEPQEDDAE